MLSKKKFTFVDLFCGAGGLSYSFKLRGHKLKLALDIDKNSIETLKCNFKEENEDKFTNQDIYDFINKSRLKKYINKVDIIMGGPPCQGFSTANRQNVLNDTRNKLYLSFLKVIEIIKPKFVLIENVNGIKKISKEIINKLSYIGYHANFKTLQSSEFGIPQNRKRVFFLGVKKSNKSLNKIHKFFDYLDNVKSKQKKYNLKDALFNLRPLKAKKIKNDTKNENFESGFNIEKSNSRKVNSYINKINNNKKINFVYNHKARYNNIRDIEIFGLLPQGGDSTHKSIKKIMPYKRRDDIFKDKYFKLQSNKICKTITSHMKFDCNMYIHPTQARGLTPREAARVQSFPDEYFFTGTLSQCYSQIGNAVPPLLSNFLCQGIEKILND